MNTLRELYIEITNKCLLKCIHCSSDACLLNSPSIPLGDICRIINEALPLGLQKICLSGGEPLLHPHFMEIVQFARNLNLDVCIYSSGVYSEGSCLISIPEVILKSLKDCGIFKAIFSLHGSSPQSHGSITSVPESFDLVMESISKTLHWGIEAEIHFVPTSINYREIPSIIKLADKMGITQVSLLRLVQQGRAQNHPETLAIHGRDGEVIVAAVEALRKIHPAVNIRLGSPFNCVNQDSAVFCSAGQHKLLISANGEVFPCEAFKYLKNQMLSIHNHSIEYIWKNDLLLNRIRELSLSKISTCNHCGLAEKCHGGCPGERMLFNGDIEIGPEIWCPII